MPRLDLLSLFYDKNDRIHYFDIHHSIFDIRYLIQACDRVAIEFIPQRLNKANPKHVSNYYRKMLNCPNPTVPWEGKGQPPDKGTFCFLYFFSSGCASARIPETGTALLRDITKKAS
jgi:hypothetical protein